MRQNKIGFIIFFVFTSFIFCDNFFKNLEFKTISIKRELGKEQFLIPKIPYSESMEESLNFLKNYGFKITNFTVYPSNKTPKFKTEGIIGYDEKNLCIYLWTEKSKNYNLKARKYYMEEGNIWYDDNLEIFLMPVVFENIYYQIIVNPLGEIYDTKYFIKETFDAREVKPTKKIETISDIKWDSLSKKNVEVGENYWSLFIKIPFKSLVGDYTQEGSLWKINICRSYQETGELVQWILTPGSFHQPDKFPIVKMQGELNHEIDFELPILGYGENVLYISYENKDQKDLKGILKIELKQDETTLYTDEKIIYIKGRKGKIPVKFPILQTGKFEILCFLKIYDNTFFYKKFLDIDQIIKCEIENPYIYKGEKEIKGNLTLNLGEETIKNSKLKFEIENERKKEKEVQIKGNLVNFIINSEELKEGEYPLKIFIVGEKGILSEYNTKIFIFPSF